MRTAVYKLFETHIFPFCKEEVCLLLLPHGVCYFILMHPLFKLACYCEYVQDNQRIMVLLLRPSIFLAMADSLIDVRLMAFDFLHLVVEYYPPTFFLYAEKVCILKDYYKSIFLFLQDIS